MAKKRNSLSDSSLKAQSSFDKGLTTDVNDYHLPENSWTYARNAINTSKKGDLGKLSNEFSNVHCTYAPYTLIGAIHLEKSRWVLFSTNNFYSEIGEFNETACSYTQLVNDSCLNFSTDNLIKGVSRPTFDCSFNVYFADGRNEDRKLDIGNIPWVQECTDSNGDDPGGCVTCIDKLDSNDKKILDCDKIRLESYLSMPCITVRKGAGGGSILNGSYHVHVAYTINQQKVTDYFAMSNVVSAFDHSNVNNSLEIELSGLDENFEEYQLILVSTISEKTVARNLGLYSTNQNHVTIDFVDNTLPVVALEELPLLTPVPDKSDAIFENGKYLLRSAPTDKFDFNYQPLANQIESFWTCVEYPKEYYKRGGVNVGNMRDETYPYFIRFTHNTGDKSKLYHIPGRGPVNWTVPSDAGGITGIYLENDDSPSTVNDLETAQGYTPKVFEVYNTATVSSALPTSIPTGDGGTLVAYGKMAYHESSEFYDDKNPEVWNSSSHPWSSTGNADHDLCGKPIRHHKFPENVITSGGTKNSITNHYTNGGVNIRILGVKFENIKPPVDNDGNVIKSIVGFEILRGSRNGNKTVLYKGMINNMFEYNLPAIVNGSSRKGLYANYPFNDLRPDPYISKSATHFETVGGLLGHDPNDALSRKHFTFHSPDVMFNKPFLSDDELKIYGEVWGDSQGKFTEVKNHPKHKFITDLSFGVAVIAGIGYAIAKSMGTRDIRYSAGQHVDTESLKIGTSNTEPISKASGITAALAAKAAEIILQGSENTLSLLDSLTGQTHGLTSSLYLSKMAQQVIDEVGATIPGSSYGSGNIEQTYKDVDRTPVALRLVTGTPMFLNYLGDGTNSFMRLIQAICKYRQFALQYQSVCNYENFKSPGYNNIRKKLNIVKYLNNGLFDLNDGGNGHLINHLNRQETVVLNTIANVNDPTITDVSRSKLMSQIPNSQDFAFQSLRASSHYVAIKNRLRNQYGKLGNIKALPTQSCATKMYDIVDNERVYVDKTEIIYGGDTYIGMYSEKNTMYYFQQWLNGQPDGYEHNYHSYQMLEHISFWMDTEPFDMAEFMQSVPTALQASAGAFSGSGAGPAQTFFNTLVTPSDKHCFDRLNNTGMFALKNAYMYLFNSGARNFFVESEINIDYRDHGDEVAKQHYPITTDLETMFHNNIIKADNYYKFDRSLAVSYLPFSKIPWGSMQELNYNPVLSASCYVKRPRRLLYSLPQETEAKKDNWSVFLPYNYKDFTSEVTTVKAIDKTAALILFQNNAPGILPGVDTIQTGSGTHLQIGDGSLFARSLQQLSNAEGSFEYASCQNRLSVINTPAGVFWMSQSQGKIFQYAGGIKELSMKNNRMWLNQYMPYKLTADFPTFELLDNPVSGIGCQSIYDNEYGIVYFCKKDYTLKDEFKGDNPVMTIEYLGGSKFLIGGMFTCELGNPLYFNNASWTLSYDPKAEEFVSYHDWHPDLALSGKNSFITTKLNSLWRHNQTCQSYCNFYGVDYPFEVEFQLDSKFAVSTMKNIEYYLENFVYDKNCFDRFMALDHNFDEAIIHNTEQVSGVLKLNINPKNDINAMLGFPKVNMNDIDILFSKEEQQYRFNQFWDITRDRGEFTGVMEPIWKTEDNGYIRKINLAAVNYNKADFEKKKFRHHNNRVILKKTKSDNVEMLISLAFADLLASRR